MSMNEKTVNGIKQIWCEEDEMYYPELKEENGRMYRLDPNTWTYLEELSLGLTPEQEEMMKEPIGRYGKAWQKYMEENHPEAIPSLQGRMRWWLIPREIDREAEEQYQILAANYEETNSPRPTTFNEIAAWEKMKIMTCEHQVMEDIVLQYRA